MLRIGKLTDYATLIMSYMAQQPETIFSASFLAESLHLTGPTVSKILKMLAEGDLVSSLRGAEGGYKLSRLPERITLADIITTMEGVAVTECCEKNSLCSIHSLCRVRTNWRQMNQLLRSLFSRFTLLDMLKPLPLANEIFIHEK